MARGSCLSVSARACLVGGSSIPVGAWRLAPRPCLSDCGAGLGGPGAGRGRCGSGTGRSWRGRCGSSRKVAGRSWRARCASSKEEAGLSGRPRGGSLRGAAGRSKSRIMSSNCREGACLEPPSKEKFRVTQLNCEGGSRSSIAQELRSSRCQRPMKERMMSVRVAGPCPLAGKASCRASGPPLGAGADRAWPAMGGAWVAGLPSGGSRNFSNSGRSRTWGGSGAPASLR